MGVRLTREGTTVSLEGGQSLTACDVDVEGDGVIRKRSTTARKSASLLEK